MAEGIRAPFTAGDRRDVRDALARDAAAPLRTLEREVARPQLSRAGQLAAWGIEGTALVLLGASALDLDLGLPTFLAALVVAALVTFEDGAAFPGIMLRISWSVLPLVAGLFVRVEAVEHSGALEISAGLLHRASPAAPLREVWRRHSASRSSRTW